MIEIKFYPLDITYKIKEGKSYVYLYGKTKEKKNLCLVEPFEPYFYVKSEGDLVLLQKEIEKLEVEDNQKKLKVKRTIETEKEYSGQKIKLIKVFTNSPRERNLFRKKLEEKGLSCFEYDLPCLFQYLRDKKITPLTLVRVKGEPLKNKSKVPLFLIKEIKPENSEVISDLKILSFDIETYTKRKALAPEKDPLLMISFYGSEKEKPFKKTIIWKKFRTKLNYLTFVKSEEELIKKFKETIEQYQPDLLVGYFSDGFDLPYLQKRAEIYGISLDLSKDFSPLVLKKREETQAKFTGLIHLDLFKFIKNVIGKSLETETLTLGAVAQELLGYQKHNINLDKLTSVWDEKPEELEEFCKYNLHDAYLTYELCLKLMPHLIELVKLVGLPLFDISRMSFSRLVENYILKRSQEFNVLARNKPSHQEIEWRRAQSYLGGFVYEPTPGIYEKIIVFDFKSLYPTLIASHNISPETLMCDCCQKEKVPGEEFWFCKKKKGFFSLIVEDLILRRNRIKEIIKLKKKKKENTTLLEARNYCLKTMANSFYGYLGFFAARWYCLECAKSITAYARHYIKTTMKKAKEKGFKICYGDTDSLMIVLDKKTKEEAKNFREEINKTLPGLIELEFEGFYLRGIFVPIKGKSYGAKKKYALFDGEKIKIVGFEAIRRNWSKIAKETQDKVLALILKEKNYKKALAFVQETIQKLREGKVKLADLVIKTQLTRPLEHYESINPHVRIAERMKKKGYSIVPGMVISFVVGKGEGLIREKAKMLEEISEGEYDPEYYVKNQIIPAVNTIFLALGLKKNFLEFKEKAQKGLKNFF